MKTSGCAWLLATQTKRWEKSNDSPPGLARSFLTWVCLWVWQRNGELGFGFPSDFPTGSPPTNWYPQKDACQAVADPLQRKHTLVQACANHRFGPQLPRQPGSFVAMCLPHSPKQLATKSELSGSDRASHHLPALWFSGLEVARNDVGPKRAARSENTRTPLGAHRRPIVSARAI